MQDITDQLYVKGVMEFMITKEARKTVENADDAKTDAAMVAALQTLLAKDEFAGGYCIDCFPRNAGQANELKSKGIKLDAVVVVEVEEAEILAFHARRVVDPETNVIYDTELNPPPEDIKDKCVKRPNDEEAAVKEKIAPFFKDIAGVKEVFGDIVITVKGTPEKDKVGACISDLMEKLKAVKPC